MLRCKYRILLRVWANWWSLEFTFTSTSTTITSICATITTASYFLSPSPFLSSSTDPTSQNLKVISLVDEFRRQANGQLGASHMLKRAYLASQLISLSLFPILSSIRLMWPPQSCILGSYKEARLSSHSEQTIRVATHIGATSGVFTLLVWLHILANNSP